MEKNEVKFKREGKRTGIWPEETRAIKAKILREKGINQTKILR